MGYLAFDCAEEIYESATLFFTLTGTDMDAYGLLSASVAVTGTELEDELEDPTLTLTFNDDSTASMTTLDALCPDVGSAMVWFAPSGTTAPDATEDTVVAAYDEYSAAL